MAPLAPYLPLPLQGIAITHTISKLHDRAKIEQNSENKSYKSILGDPKTVFEPYPNPTNDTIL